MQKKVKSYLMPIALILGVIFPHFFAELSFLIPYLIFTMLFFTYCNINLAQIQIKPLHIWLIAIQMIGSVLVYLAISPFNVVVAQGAMICVLAPTATAAPVITSMLKGNVSSLISYSLISNLCVLMVAPIIFSMVGRTTNLSFFESFMGIFQRVALLLLGPLVLAVLIRKFSRISTETISKLSASSFYLWVFALCVVTGRTIEFIVKQNTANHFSEVLLAFLALFICVSLFFIGRVIGRKYDETVVGGQSLGQKNTILAIWMAQTYLNPISSIAPGAYVLWQNIINSTQVWRMRKK